MYSAELDMSPLLFHTFFMLFKTCWLHNATKPLIDITGDSLSDYVIALVPQLVLYYFFQVFPKTCKHSLHVSCKMWNYPLIVHKQTTFRVSFLKQGLDYANQQHTNKNKYRLYTNSFTNAVVLPKTCKRTLMCKLVELPFKDII